MVCKDLCPVRSRIVSGEERSSEGVRSSGSARQSKTSAVRDPAVSSAGPGIAAMLVEAVRPGLKGSLPWKGRPWSKVNPESAHHVRCADTADRPTRCLLRRRVSTWEEHGRLAGASGSFTEYRDSSSWACWPPVSRGRRVSVAGCWTAHPDKSSATSNWLTYRPDRPTSFPGIVAGWSSWCSSVQAARSAISTYPAWQRSRNHTKPARSTSWPSIPMRANRSKILPVMPAKPGRISRS